MKAYLSFLMNIISNVLEKGALKSEHLNSSFWAGHAGFGFLPQATLCIHHVLLQMLEPFATNFADLNIELSMHFPIVGLHVMLLPGVVGTSTTDQHLISMAELHVLL